ncbi:MULTISPECIES: DUF547 domain-containing protein [unclassified Lentimonas]|uniref:DUF547 domain-containing protein n=1 Tax=unclassified Lentimonas TaxID=2630993 RepID=UPI001322C80B|nr:MULTISPECIES: DUF547 domain-containing protein [unclassified Lentimonas]CAA6678373.1 Uncharacterized protein DUF547 [Lentimonas sp. CC4]CAA6685465.1 Uncharacterized protein DUF547 [Lentimonas sp. CC6]CAA6690550.1 Uncharacterized protein DUF547 [Lentimonas sp. CC10]CAA6695370.1 Uncharacterized protein DUF547 [Lentimonas sp. CC19]CAA7068807.1 Uncharacterized protein DUF547 [Lentimonas sp. CC11]
MKYIMICLGIFGALGLLNASNETSGTYAELLQRYVKDDGVAYESWVANSSDVQALNSVLTDWSKVDVQKLQRAEQKAFYINVYNAAMLQAVLDHYPLKSVKEIGLLPFSVFKKKYISLSGAKVSLDHVEKGILLKAYFDPRIHFAVNCASESCPPLRAEPYVGERLDQQLDEQTRLFAESRRAARVNTGSRSTAYSELFKWYADDFGVKSPAEYLNRYRASKLDVKQSVKWIDYDWSLNASK